MTRDEAIKILKDKIWPTFGSNEAASVWLDAFVELGMLKLEDPKSVYDKVLDLMGNSAIVRGTRNMRVDEFYKALEEYGLKIVEK